MPQNFDALEKQRVGGCQRQALWALGEYKRKSFRGISWIYLKIGFLTNTHHTYKGECDKHFSTNMQMHEKADGGRKVTKREINQ